MMQAPVVLRPPSEANHTKYPLDAGVPQPQDFPGAPSVISTFARRVENAE